MANRIKGSSMTVYANDTQLDRIQTFGVSSRLDSEDLREIGNLDIVEVLDNVPTVDITCDANQYGSLKTLAKFAGKNRDWGNLAVFLKTAAHATATVKVADGYYFIDEMKYTLTGTQGFTDYLLVAGDKPATGMHAWLAITVDSAGTIDGVKGADVSDATPLNHTTNMPTVPAGSLLLALVYVKYQTDMVASDILNCNAYSEIKLKDFEFAKVDFTCPVKESGDNTTTDDITRTMYVENAYINRYDAAFSVNGLATESFSLESDNKVWFLNGAGAVYVQRIQDATELLTVFDLDYAPTARTNGNTAVKAYTYNSTSGAYTLLTEVASAGAAGEFSIAYNVDTWELTVGAALTATDTLVVRYAVDPSLISDADMPFFKRTPSEIDPHPVVPGGLRHGQVEVYLSDDANNFVLRLQSVSISSSLTREPLYEIGHKRAYDRPLTFPIPITVQVEALQSDLKEFARLCGQTFSGAGEATELSIDQFLKNLDLTVKIYREDDVARATMSAAQSIPLKTIVVQDVSITDEANELRVDGNGTQTFGMKANTNLSVFSRI